MCGCPAGKCCSNGTCIDESTCPDLGCCSSPFGALGMCVSQLRCPGECCSGGLCGCLAFGAGFCCDGNTHCVQTKDCPAPNAGCCKAPGFVCGCPPDEACFGGACRKHCLPGPPRVPQPGTSPLVAPALGCAPGEVCCGAFCCPAALCCNGNCGAPGLICSNGGCVTPCPACQTFVNGTCQPTVCPQCHRCDPATNTCSILCNGGNSGCPNNCPFGDSSCCSGQCCGPNHFNNMPNPACCGGTCIGPCDECYHSTTPGAVPCYSLQNNICVDTCVPMGQICSPVNCSPRTWGCCYANGARPPGGCTGNGPGQCCPGMICQASNNGGNCVPSGFPGCP